MQHSHSFFLQVQDLLKDPCFDRLSVVAMETIMMSHICFPRDADDYDQVTENTPWDLPMGKGN